jgi:FMN phosphatase YigB (HAD superfamily)
MNTISSAPSSEKKDVVIVGDWELVLDRDDKLVKAMAEYAENGADLSICSSLYNETKRQNLIDRGLDKNYTVHVIPGYCKNSVDGWKKAIDIIRTETGKDIKPSNIIVLDDSWWNCKEAAEAGYFTILWDRQNSTCLDKLHQAMADRGYKRTPA